MKIINWIILFIVVLVAGAILFSPLASVSEPTTHEIIISANQFSYNPPIVRVNRGDKVIFTLQSTDVVHGFYLDGYEIQQEFAPGSTETVEFIANNEGKFRFRCSVVCGELHPFMIGELIVQPNSPFVISLKISGVALLVTLLFIRLSPIYKNDRILLGS